MRFYRFFSPRRAEALCAAPLVMLLLGAPLLGLSLQGCSNAGVGDPCLPEQIPATGFSLNESYVESSSVQCATRVCLVYHLNGDPHEGCVPVSCAKGDKTCVEKVCPQATCPGMPGDNCVESRVYCSCRCGGGGPGFAACQCPTGFSCQEVLTQGGPGVRGSYCLRDGTFSKSTGTK